MADSNLTTYGSCHRTGIPYVRTSTSIPTGEAVNVSYGAGYFTGTECKDVVVVYPHMGVNSE